MCVCGERQTLIEKYEVLRIPHTILPIYITDLKLCLNSMDRSLLKSLDEPSDHHESLQSQLALVEPCHWQPKD